MKDYLASEIQKILDTWDGVPKDFEIQFQPPANPEFGDLASNLAMQLARALKKNPRQIAQDLVYALSLDPEKISSVEIAGPGFLNFRFATDYLHQGIRTVLAEGVHFGKSTVGKGQKAMVEYISANPTGPLTVGHGRNAVLGDTIANLLEWTGYEVTREYYFNDAGRQMRILAQSVYARYVERLQPDCPKKIIDGNLEVPEIFPEGGYQGAYIVDIADTIGDIYGDSLVGSEDLTLFKKTAQQLIFQDIEQTMLRMGVKMDVYFNEHSLYEDGSIEKTLDRLREKGVVFEKEGAIWFKTSELGKEKDTVLVKSSGEPTYRLPDIAYHINKLDRGFDLVIDVFGADHIATYPDVLRALQVLGYDATKIEVCIYQFVTLMRGDQPVKMSTRKANFITVDDLMDEVTPDVTRYYFNMVSPTTHMNFDLDAAKEASEKNPVFYVQYGHARTHAIERKTEEEGYTLASVFNLKRLTHEAEITLMKEVLNFPKAVQLASNKRQPHLLIEYLREVTKAFSQFYHHCHIIGEGKELGTARMALLKATQIVLKNGLTILGISAPEQM